MPAPPPVTLQVSLAPGDHRLAGSLLAHQVDFWRPCVDEILLTIDTRRSRGRFGDDWENGRRRILEIAGAISGARIIEVDYSPAAQHAVAAAFFGGAPVPAKDCRGGPYYAYFFGLHTARHDVVLHSDADMFFGGASGPWMHAALALYSAQPDLFFTAPHPGPPAPDGKLKQLTTTPEHLHGHAGHRFTAMSTRLFLFDRARFRERVVALTPRPPATRARVLAWLDGHPAQELPEVLFSEAMSTHGLQRFDFAGPAPGCWSLHPPYRSEDFFQKLPGLIQRIEKADLPTAQLGDHDLNASLVDWTEAHARMARRRWWHRLANRLGGSRA